MTDDFYESEATITLSYVHNDGDQYQFTFEEPLTWPEALDKMIKFINNIYGYDVSSQVALRYKNTAIKPDCWNGPFFDTEDEISGPGLSD
jgi:hypothetical protein